MHALQHSESRSASRTSSPSLRQVPANALMRISLAAWYEEWEGGVGGRSGREEWEGGVGGRSGREEWEGGVGGRSGREEWEGGVGGGRLILIM